MKYLIDREQCASGRARSRRARQRPADRPTNRFHFAGLPQRPYDLDKAKFHLKKSGIGEAAVPVVTSPAALYSVEMGLVMQQSAQKIGLNLDVKRMPADGYWSNHWLNSQVGFGNVNPRPSADTLLTLFYKSDAAWNESRFKSEKFDQLLISSRAENDAPSASSRRRHAGDDPRTGRTAIPLFLATSTVSNKLKGLSPIPWAG